MTRATLNVIVEAVDLADVFLTFGACSSADAAAGEACAALVILDGSDRRIVQHLLERRQESFGLLVRRAA